MVASSSEDKKTTRWLMYLLELTLIAGGWVYGYAKMGSSVDQNSKDIAAVEVRAESRLSTKLDRQMFEMHKGDDDKRFEREEKLLETINAKLDGILLRGVR